MIETVALTAFIFFSSMFLIALIKNDISWIDVGWGLSFFVLTMVLMFKFVRPIGSLQVMCIFLVSAWALRLTWYLLKRNLAKGEDERYTEISKNWKGPKWLNAYFRIFMVQGFLHALIAAPIALIFMLPPANLNWLSAFAAAVAMFMIVFEALADSHLEIFKNLKNKPSQFCRLGVWKHSRHPNYFAEISFWWAIGVMSLQNTDYPFLGFIGPLIITIAILKLSGVPPLEKRFKKREGWEQYKAETRLLLPIPRKLQ